MKINIENKNKEQGRRDFWIRRGLSGELSAASIYCNTEEHAADLSGQDEGPRCGRVVRVAL